MYWTSLLLSNMLARSSSLSLNAQFSLKPGNLLSLRLSSPAHEEPLVSQVESLAHGQGDLLSQLVRYKHVAGVDIRVSFFGYESEEPLLSFVIRTVRYPVKGILVLDLLRFWFLNCQPIN